MAVPSTESGNLQDRGAHGDWGPPLFSSTDDILDATVQSANEESQSWPLIVS